MNACASRGQSRWPAVFPADLYLDMRQRSWAVWEACGRIRFQRWGRHGEIPKVLVAVPEVVEALAHPIDATALACVTPASQGEPR